jgi:HEAT repeat protein
MTIIKKALDAGKNDCAAIGALANMGGDKALALLEKELDSKKWNRKLAAIKALDFIGSDKALAILGAYRQRVGSGDNKGDNRLDREVLGMFDVDRQRELHDVRAEKSK